MDGDVGTIGITDHAQEQLGDVVFVELPEVGQTIDKDDTMGAVESVKAASDIYIPVTGEVIEVNEALNDDPALVNTAAESDGWMAKVKLSDMSQLDELMVRRARPPTPSHARRPRAPTPNRGGPAETAPVASLAGCRWLQGVLRPISPGYRKFCGQ
jgi:glycine cleavage system H protein